MATVGDAGELREDIPLKSGAKSSRLCSCDEDFFGGSRFITFAFAILSVIITVALLVQIYYGDYQVTPHGSVATDSRECSTIGSSVLKDGGNAVDAAIASAFCLAVVNPHTTGLDASGQILIYSHQTRINPTTIDFSNVNLESSKLPRLVIELAYIHQRYSNLPWKRLVQPAADLAKNGFLVPRMLVTAIQNFQATKLFGYLEAGHTLLMEQLGHTLEDIANIPEEDLYAEIPLQTHPLESQSLALTFKYYNIYVPGMSDIGLGLLINLQHIDNMNITTADVAKPDYISKLTDITIATYNDLNITTKFYHGTSSNIAAMDLNDLYVSLVTGMYAPFGTRQMTLGGYLLDVKSSALLPSRMPLIITDTDFVCGRRIALGVSDIATGSQVITSLLIAAENATSSIEAPRFNVLVDGTIGIEDAHASLFSDPVVKDLENRGHKVVLVNEPYNSCNVVEKAGDSLNSHSDSRGGGIASRF